MNLVDRDRAVARVLGAARGHPGFVGPGRVVGALQDGGGLGRLLRREGDRIGLEREERAVGAADLVLVVRAGLQARYEQLPDSAVLPQPHGVATAVPLVEVADHADAAGIGCPDREAETCDAVDRLSLRAEDAVGDVAADLAQGFDVALVQGRAEAVGIVTTVLGAVPGLVGDLVERASPALDAGDVEALRMPAFERDPGSGDEERHRFRLRQDGADLPDARSRLVRSEHREGISMGRRHDRRDGLGRDGPGRRRCRRCVTDRRDVRGPGDARGRVGFGRERLVDPCHSEAFLDVV